MRETTTGYCIEYKRWNPDGKIWRRRYRSTNIVIKDKGFAMDLAKSTDQPCRVVQVKRKVIKVFK